MSTAAQARLFLSKVGLTYATATVAIRMAREELKPECGVMIRIYVYDGTAGGGILHCHNIERAYGPATFFVGPERSPHEALPSYPITQRCVTEIKIPHSQRAGYHPPKPTLKTTTTSFHLYADKSWVSPSLGAVEIPIEPINQLCCIAPHTNRWRRRIVCTLCSS